jgi:hypothetical protein
METTADKPKIGRPTKYRGQLMKPRQMRFTPAQIVAIQQINEQSFGGMSDFASVVRLLVVEALEARGVDLDEGPGNG